MNKFFYYLVTMLFSLILVGCSPFCPSYTIEIQPDSLPIAKVGQPYYAQITTDVAMLNMFPVISSDNRSFNVIYKDNMEKIILPNNLTVNIIDRSITEDGINRIKISGMPTASGEYTLHIGGANRSDMLCRGKKLEKIYVLKIKD